MKIRIVEAAEVIALCAVGFAAVEGGLAFQQFRKTELEIQNTAQLAAKTLPVQVLTELHSDAKLFNESLNQQLGQVVVRADKQLTATREGVLAQTGPVMTQAAGTISRLSDVAESLNLVALDSDRLVANANTVVSDNDIPKIVRSTRNLIDQTALTMGHIRGAANTISLALPEFVRNANSVTGSIAHISLDISTITADATKKKPWPKQALGYIGATVKIGSVFFRPRIIQPGFHPAIVVR